MSLPADAMSNPVTPPPEPTYIILARKLILLSLIMVVAALGLVILFRHVQVYFLLLPHVLSDAAMGIMAGFSVRWILRKQTAFLRIASTLAFVICGLELVGWFTGWQVGLGPLKVGRTSVDWFGLGQLILAAGIAFLALYAWKHPVQKVGPAAPPSEVKETARPRKWPKRCLTLKPPLQKEPGRKRLPNRNGSAFSITSPNCIFPQKKNIAVHTAWN